MPNEFENLLSEAESQLLDQALEALDSKAPDDSSLDKEKNAKLILAEFQAALNAPDMGLDDDFFDHGGHSLIATRVIGRLLSQHSIEICFNDIFSNATAATLAAHAKQKTPQPKVENVAAETTVSAALDETQTAPLSFAQKSLWKLYSAFNFNQIFNIPFALRFLDPIDESAFEAAFRDLMVRHPVLRSLFREESGDTVQEIVSTEDLEAYKWFWFSYESTAADRQAEAKHLFDLSKELPLRLRFMVDEETGEQILSLLFHHVALDEWSVNLLMDELALAYRERASGGVPKWPDTPRPFHQFAIKQNQAGLDPSHLTYWTDLLSDAPKELSLFPESTPAKESSAAGGWVEYRLENNVADGLYSVAKANDASLFNVVYAAITAALHKLGNLDDLTVGTSVAARNDTEFFDTIGYFTTVVTHRIGFSENLTPAKLIQDVKRNVNESMPHSDVPIDLVQEALAKDEATKRENMFEVFIQLHAKNKFNGEFELQDGQKVRFRQIDPDKTESMLGLQFEVLEENIDGETLIRVMMSYRSDKYGPDRVKQIEQAVTDMFARFSDTGAMTATL